MKNIKFSIITVTYNSEKYVENTLESLLDQSYDNYEYIIIDGGSTDNTIAIIKKFIPLFNGKLKYISEPDDGIYDAMNKGIRIAQSDYVGIINSDDLYYEHCLINVNKLVQSSPDIPDVVYSDMTIIDMEGKEIDIIVGDDRKLKKGMLVNHPTCFVNMDTYKRFGEFDLKYEIAADYDLMLRIHQAKGVFVKSDKILSKYRVGGISYNSYKSVLEKFQIQKKYFSITHCVYIWLRGYYRCVFKPILSRMIS